MAASRVDVKIRFIVGHLGLGENKRTKNGGGRRRLKHGKPNIKTNFNFRANGKTYLGNGKTLNFLGLHIE